ncbi:hypothetical protein FA95DRAFT_1022387 [Auriscalpium vulgare]|uniref:Uncharacterized protein n=1 Tax=Auriscalpium vulgare TaxID=40419 RepID=A0ACB8RXL5_9AGAM|nr:hypothetical protein FA95DRAFT_1022387 [Auriscalpium vulgare]
MTERLAAIAKAQLEALRQTILAQSNEIGQQQKQLQDMQAVIEEQNDLIKAHADSQGHEDSEDDTIDDPDEDDMAVDGVAQADPVDDPVDNIFRR